MERFKIIAKNKLNELPKTSGVYSFWNKNELAYIGKAINIKDRVKNHFQQPSYRDNLFIDKVTRIGFFETNSEIEALILEANLIKKHQPKFNVIWRDDKNYFYVAFAQNDQKIPYVFITHRPQAYRHPMSILDRHRVSIVSIGPFVEGTALKKTLKFLRRVFPYYTVKNHPKTNCMYCHLGLCPGPNPNLPEYKKNIKKLILILKGKRSAVLKSLKQEMKSTSKENKFEEAGKIRDRIFALQQVMSHTHVIAANSNSNSKLEGQTFQWLKTEKMLQGLLNLNRVSRIECYDVSNIQGKQATGSMIVFIDGEPDKNLYRKFRIRMKNEPNDIAMLKETLERRFSHPEWKYPEVILIDGGIAQLNVAIRTKNEKAETKNIKIISIAKRNKELYIEGGDKPVLLKTLPRKIYNLILQLDDEAHRFAIAYHKKLRKKSLLP